MTVKVRGPAMVVPILASHPDIRDNPVKVRVFSTDNLFKQKTLLDEVVLEENVWKDLRFDFSDRIWSEFLLYFEVSRTWRPSDALSSPDPRSLGVAVGELRFEDSSPTDDSKASDAREPGELKDKSPSRTGEKSPSESRDKVLYTLVPSEEKREIRGSPIGDGRWYLDVSLPEGDYLFRLRAKGQEVEKEWPLAGIWIDDRLIGEEWIDSEDWKDYYFRSRLKEGKHTICVELMNEADFNQTQKYRTIIPAHLEIIAK